MFRRRLSLIFSWLAVLAVGLTVGQGTAFSASKKKRRAAAQAVETPAEPTVVAKARPLRTEGPNVVLIIADGLNDWVGWMGGHPQARTPNMDRLAKMGMSFTNVHTAYAGDDASRAALLTGMWPWKSGVSADERDWQHTAQVMNQATLPEQLQLAGFMTAAAGSVSHGPDHDPAGKSTPRTVIEADLGWDAHWPTSLKQSAGAVPSAKVEGLPKSDLRWAPLDAKDEDTTDGKTVVWAANYLQKQPADMPFFLAIGLSSPDAPWYVPAKYLDERPLAEVKLPEVKEDDLADVPEAASKPSRETGLQQKLTDKKLPPAVVRAYLAGITYCDAMVGRVLDALEQSPHKDNTVIILTSSLGRSLGEKQNWGQNTLWEVTTRVPLIVVAPKFTQPGTQSAQPVSLVDLYATLCELTALPKPAHLDGSSLVSLMKDPTQKQSRPAFTAVNGGSKAGAGYSVRTERHRYTRHNDGSEELYDHETDPQEWDNLLAPGKTLNSDMTTAVSGWKAALPKEWASTHRLINAVKLDAAADGSVTYWLQAGDSFPAASAPDILGRGLDFEAVFNYNPEVDANSTIISQGDERLGYAVHLIGGVPAFTVNYDGLRGTLKGTQPLTAGKTTLRALFGLDGTLAVGAAGAKEEIRGFAPMEGGFPRQPEGPLAVGRSFGPLPAALYPNSTAFSGGIERVNFGLLPGTSVELRAAKAVPVE